MKETPWPGNIDWLDDWLDLYHPGQQSIRGKGLMGSPLVNLGCEFFHVLGKLDGVGPVDKRPYTAQAPPIVKIQQNCRNS